MYLFHSIYIYIYIVYTFICFIWLKRFSAVKTRMPFDTYNNNKFYRGVYNTINTIYKPPRIPYLRYHSKQKPKIVLISFISFFIFWLQQFFFFNSIVNLKKKHSFIYCGSFIDQIIHLEVCIEKRYVNNSILLNFSYQPEYILVWNVIFSFSLYKSPYKMIK